MYMRGGTSGLAIGDDGFGVSIYLNNSNNIAFNTGAGTEVMQIDSVGNCWYWCCESSEGNHSKLY